jgi:hypothetical protein
MNPSTELHDERSTMRIRYPLIMAALVGAATLVAAPAAPAQALAPFTMSVVSPVEVRIGVDAIYSGAGGGGEYDIKTCSASGEPTLGWIPGAGLSGTRTLVGTPTQLRFEMYPGACGTYDGWDDTVGGVHFEVDPRLTVDYGQIVMPRLGNPGVLALRGPILSSTPVTTGRVAVDAFQIDAPPGLPDPARPLQQNGVVAYGAFGSTRSRGNEWSAGVGWGGRYLMFIEDRTRGTKILASVDIDPNRIPTIDLDAICFGFENCVYQSGGPEVTAGTFHPVDPTRILDTRRQFNLWGALPTGDGRSSSPNPFARRSARDSHDLLVTGRYGVPVSGVSAVLLNVTAISAGGSVPGYLSVGPRPHGTGDVFDDQNTYREIPGTSNLNVNDGNPTPNMVLARVGAGGKIRIANYPGPTHVVADIAGWFGTGGAHTDGAGFAGVVPDRILDSRNGIGTPDRPFAAGETRTVQVAGRSGIPTNAQSVVVNITLTGASRTGFVTAFPDGQPLPDASNVNIVAGGVRSNTAVVRVGAGGRIALRLSETDADVIVDVLGSFGPYGGRITTVTPQRIVDSRTGLGTPMAPFGEDETRNVQVAGRGRVPAGATAVIANVTATNTSAWGFLTAWPAGNARPTTSNLNFLPGQTVPNLVMLRLGTNGQLAISNGRGVANVIVDVMGYVI